MRKRPFLLLCCISCCFLATGAYGETIVVTTTANSGPGSLREAIGRAAANGTATTDYIHFNIAQTVFNRRIINLLSPLPPLTSNLVIDGTTQPGEKFAITDAKICLKKDDFTEEFALFTISNASHVSIYGLYMLYGYWRWDIELGNRSEKLYAIQLSNAFDIEIGAPGKGNVINGYHYGIYSNSDSCRNIRIRSNYMGQGLYYTDYTKDVDEVVISVAAGITLLNAKDVLIGGATVAEGNVIKANRAILLDSRYETGNGFIHIRNNVFGKDYDRTRVLSVSDPYVSNIYIGESANYLGESSRIAMDYEVHILNNDIPTSLGLKELSKHFFIKGNFFEVPANFAEVTNMEAKLTITDCASGEVGGSLPGDSNIFRFGGVDGEKAIHAVRNGPVTISKNVFECNMHKGGSPTYVVSAKTLVPFVRIDQTSSTRVSGIATPNSTVEIFYDDECSGCEGDVFIGSTTSDINGDWSFSGTIAKPVIATATTGLGATGEFSTPEADMSNIVLTHPDCGRNGSITGIAVRGGDGYMWQDSLGNIISTNPDLLNAGPGRYSFYARLGNNCVKYGGTWSLIDGSISVNALSADVTMVTCNKSNGSIHITSLDQDASRFRFHWLLDSSAIIGTGLQIENLAPGRYQCIATDIANGCQKQIYANTVNALPLPSINSDELQVKPDTCNLSAGSITGLSVMHGTSGMQYQWVDDAAQIVGQQIDLRNVGEGTYYLEIILGDQCSVKTMPYEIENVPRVIEPPVYTDVTIPKGSPVTLVPGEPATGTWSLFNSSTGGIALQQNNSGTFDLPAMNSDNTFYIEIQRGDCASPRVPVSIKVVDESFALIPNAFTPNGDGRNDTWGVSIIGIIKFKQLRVFNRWGQMIFETTDPGRRWDGRYRGKMLGSGSYFYILFGTDHSGKAIEKKGTVTIVR